MADEQATTQGKQLVLQKIYVKDLSFESPKSPDVFKTTVSPQTQLNMRTANKDVGDDNVEVVLTLTIEAKNGEDTLFLIEIAQAGVFLIHGYTAEERGAVIGSFCPATLYPFAREAISDLVSKGGFPQLLLQPINFDALYAQALREQQQAATTPTPDAAPQGAGEPH